MVIVRFDNSTYCNFDDLLSPRVQVNMPKAKTKAKPLGVKVGLVDEVDDSVEMNRGDILKKYLMHAVPINIPLSQVQVATRDDSKLDMGFKVSTLRAESGTNPVFAASMAENGWDPTCAGVVQMVATQHVFEAYTTMGDTTAFNTWCMDQVISHGAPVTVVDGVHRTVWMRAHPRKAATPDEGVFLLLGPQCPSDCIEFIAGTSNNITGNTNPMLWFDFLTIAHINNKINHYNHEKFAHLVRSSTMGKCTTGRASQLIVAAQLFDKKAWMILHDDHMQPGLPIFQEELLTPNIFRSVPKWRSTGQ